MMAKGNEECAVYLTAQIGHHDFGTAYVVTVARIKDYDSLGRATVNGWCARDRNHQLSIT